MLGARCSHTSIKKSDSYFFTNLASLPSQKVFGCCISLITFKLILLLELSYFIITTEFLTVHFLCLKIKLTFKKKYRKDLHSLKTNKKKLIEFTMVIVYDLLWSIFLTLFNSISIRGLILTTSRGFVLYIF